MINLKTYGLIINENPEEGISVMSFVENPAVEYDFLKFNKETKLTFAIQNEDKRIVTGVAMLADVPIFRTANKIIPEDHYVVFTKETIKDIILKFFKDNNISSINLNHNKKFEGAYLFESYIVNRELGVTPPKAFESIPDGSWITSYKIDNDIVWNSIKDGSFNGFSIEGFFSYTDVELVEESSLEEEFKKIHTLLAQLR